MITHELLNQFAISKGVDVTDDWARGELEENVVKPQYNGDWAAFEKDLAENYNSSLESVYKTTKQEIVVRNILKTENIEQANFDQWVYDLKQRSQIEYKINL